MNNFNHTNNEHIYNRVAESFRKQSFLTLIGAKLEHVEKGNVVVSCTKRDDLLQQQGLLHGGVVTTLADISCGYAALSAMPDDYEVLTVEMKINLMRAVTSDKIIADAHVIKAGRTLSVVESTVTDPDGKVFAKMLATMFSVPLAK